MTLHKFIASIVIVLTWNIAFGQDKYSFRPILSKGEVGKTFISKAKADTSWRTYLGEVKDNKGKIRYYVVKEFKKVQAASTWHGHNNIFFFDPNQQLIARVDVSLPEYLPYKIKDNFLYFRINENGTTSVYKTKIESTLPKLLCLKSDWCEEVISETSSVQH